MKAAPHDCLADLRDLEELAPGTFSDSGKSWTETTQLRCAVCKRLWRRVTDGGLGGGGTFYHPVASDLEADIHE